MRNVSREVKRALNEDIISENLSPETKEELQDILYRRLKNGESDFNDIDVSQITDFSNLFGGRLKPKGYIEISEWDVSNGVYFQNMFRSCRSFNADLSKWNVSKGRRFDAMFERCNAFNSDLSNWDVSKARNMSHMFEECREFNSDLSGWNVSNVEDMSYMFWFCTKLQCDLSNWDVSNVKNMNGMFG